MPLGPIRIRACLDHAALRALYEGSEPFCWSDEDGVPVTVFPNEAGPHWHYVALSAHALGRDLTFRLAARASEAEAPAWPVALLRRLARHARGCAQPIGEGGYVCFEAPVDPSGAMRCVALVPDPQLPDAILAVGLHEAELGVVSEDDYERLFGALRARDPLLVTEPARAPVVLG